MKRRLHALPRPLILTMALSSGLVAFALNAPAQDTSSTMTFQRQVDSSSPGPSGTALLKKKGANQFFSVTAYNLVGASYGVFFGAANNTNTPVFLIAVMDRQGITDTWTLRYQGVGAAPVQLPVADLNDMAGLYLFIARPGVTNISNGVTNTIVESVLFTQVQPLTPKTGAIHYKHKSLLVTPPVAPPNPLERGFVKTTFVGVRGRSVLDLFATRLSGGGAYKILLEDPPSSLSLTNIGNLVLSTETHSGTFHRDTSLGETLPFQSNTVQELSGRIIQIRDAFDRVHLEGVIP